MSNITAQKNEASKKIIPFIPENLHSAFSEDPVSAEEQDNSSAPDVIEQSLLSNLINDNLSYEEVSDFLKPEHFMYGTSKKIYEAIIALIESGKVADPISLRDLFLKDEELKEQGGVDYLATLASSVISLGNTKRYGQLIYDAYIKRQLIHIGHEIIADAKKSFLEVNSRQQIEKIEQRLYDLTFLGQIERKLIRLEENDLVEKLSKARNEGIPNLGTLTCYQKLDKMLGGLQKGDLIIIAARPSMGKTAFAVNLAYNAAYRYLSDQTHGAKVLCFSLEMSAEQLITRIYAQEATLSSDSLRKANVSDWEFERVQKADETIRGRKIPLFIDDTPCLAIGTLRSRAMKHKRLEDINLIVIDYLQMIKVDGKSGNRVQEVSEITRQLKALARDLNVPVVALSQLSRGVENREEKKPLLSDLRESGSIEQDADVVMFLYREAYYLKRAEPLPHTFEHKEWQQKMDQYQHESEIIIAKHRNGPVGTVRLRFDEVCTKFSDW